MNRKLLLSVVLMTMYLHLSLAASLFDKPFKMQGDSIPCILVLELEQVDNGDYVVSLIPDTSWTFPRNIVSTAQITIKVPTGGFVIGEITDLIDGVTFFQSGRNDSPAEAPLFDYISLSLGTQGTSNITFQKGQKVELFSFTNTGTCPDGMVHLMDNFTDPFYPPNSVQTNAGQQITVSGYGAPDLPIGVRGNGIPCNPTNPVDTTDDEGATPPINSDLSVQFAVQNVTCVAANNGIIIIKAEQGTPPYSYNWNTGATTSSIENLLPGIYTVQISDQTGFIIEHTITITEPELLGVQVSTTNTSQAGATDGVGRVIVTGGTAPYNYTWSHGANGAVVNNLAAGAYSLTVTDANGCTDEQSITIIDQSQCAPIDVLLDMQSPICSGESNGQILVTPQGGQAPFSYVWENGNGTNFIDNINAGLYMVTVTDGIGCTMAVSAMLPDASPLEITLDAEDGGMNGGQISATVVGGVAPYSYNWNTGATSTAINNLGSGVYMLSLTDNQGCERVVSEVISTMDCDLGILDALGTTMMLDEISCDDKGTLCLPVPLDSMVNYSLFLDGEDYSSNFRGCQFETFYAYSYAFFSGGNTSGNYNLREWTINETTYSTVFESIDALVDSMNVWDPTGNWVNLKEISIIQGGQPEQNYGSMTIMTGAVSTILDVNSNLTPRGTQITFKPGVHELVLVSNRNVCSDTLTIDLPCGAERRDSTLRVTVKVGEETSLCLAPLFGADLQISANSCADLSGRAAGIVLDNSLNCIAIEGFLVGTDNACYEISDGTGAIIDVTVIVNVVQEDIPCMNFGIDSIFTFAASCNPSQICTELPFDILSNAVITNNDFPYTGTLLTCGNNGTVLSFEQVGQQNLRIFNGDCVYEVIIILACDDNIVIEETIEIGTFDVVCLSTPGLLGTYETTENLCPEKGGNNALFEILGNSGCIGFTGIGVGSDTACIKVCDFFGFCDTVTLIYHVEDPTATPPPSSLLDAISDSATISLNSSIVLDILGNDVFRDLDTVYLVTEPENGQVFINPDATLTYIAQTGYCDEEQPDAFLYAICEGATCDTATVAITVNCFVNRELVVYNGLSPNGDGINDSFLVEGIENYPNNTVSVFNRWGNRVLVMEGYKNEWTGTWMDRAVLPDGTYFYIIDLGEGSELLKGFLELRR